MHCSVQSRYRFVRENFARGHFSRPHRNDGRVPEVSNPSSGTDQLSGSLTRTVVPFPSPSLSSASEPPCASATSFAT